MTVDLHVREAGSGLPLVLLHAFPLSSAMWLGQRNGLGDRFRVVTPDQRGFGGSPLGDAEPSLDLVADDVAAMLDGLGLDRGGARRPLDGRLRDDGVPAAAPGAGPRAGPGGHQGDAGPARGRGQPGADRRPAGRRGQRRCPPRRGAAEPARPEHPAGPRRRCPAGCGPWSRSTPPQAAAWAQRAMAARPDSLDMLRATDVPALVVRGDEDALASHGRRRGDGRRRCRAAGWSPSRQPGT